MYVSSGQQHGMQDEPRAARRCVFCGGRPLTREHVIPQWLTEVLPDQLPWRAQNRRIVVPGEIPSSQGLPYREVREPFNAVTVKAVCAGCNSGWMNDLETAARPTLSALIRGEVRILDAVDIEVIASWAVKTSLMVQLTAAETAAKMPAVYASFFRDRKPPPNAAVWAAGVHAEDWGLRAEAMSILIGERGDGQTVDDPPNTVAVSLGLGSLWLHSIITERPSVSYPAHHEILPDVVLPFWPNATRNSWPPRLYLDNQTAWFLAHSLVDWLDQ